MLLDLYIYNSSCYQHRHTADNLLADVVRRGRVGVWRPLPRWLRRPAEGLVLHVCLYYAGWLGDHLQGA